MRNRTDSMDATGSTMELCKDHPAERLNYWCETCERSVCTDCLASQHENHPYDLVRTFAAKLKDKVHRRRPAEDLSFLIVICYYLDWY